MPVVPSLDEGRDQLNERFPKRDKKSDGSWGDKAHSKRASSHNGDESGTPEWRDADKIDDVRARDFDKDLNDPDTTMEQVVQEWVRRARAGLMPWMRYFIYNGRIWHKRDGFATRKYTGSNQHKEHVHANSDFSEKADQTRNTDWGLKKFRKSKPKPKPTTPAKPELLKVDGALGPKTVKRWQQVMKLSQTGKLNSDFIKAVQRRLNDTVGARLVVDGKGIAQDGKKYKTVEALQRYLKSPIDGVMSKPDSHVVRALQRRLNEGRF